ncbi:MAG: STAS domain-containing protein [Gammaproteobacteria bacterium]|nr:STAS domain-containing protein [Gammaproteobacteria bacterium]
MSRITFSNTDGRTHLAIHGNFVFDLNREFRKAYSQSPPGQPVTVDLSDSTYMDSAGLGMLIRLREHAGNREDSVTLTGANDAIRTILNVANFGQLFRIT